MKQNSTGLGRPRKRKKKKQPTNKNQVHGSEGATSELDLWLVQHVNAGACTHARAKQLTKWASLPPPTKGLQSWGRKEREKERSMMWVHACQCIQRKSEFRFQKALFFYTLDADSILLLLSPVAMCNPPWLTGKLFPFLSEYWNYTMSDFLTWHPRIELRPTDW